MTRLRTEDISTSRALFLEMFMTAELVLTVLMVHTCFDISNE
jgi:glycerol uptake facilitator-like aquaporin